MPEAARKRAATCHPWLLLGLGGVLLWGAARPFADDAEGIIGGGITAEIASNYDRFGFLEMNGRPLRAAWPTREPSGWLNTNHPPAPYWLLWMVTKGLGNTPFTLRLLPTLLSLGLSIHLSRVVARRCGEIAACAAVVVLLSSFLWLHYAGMPDHVAFVMAASAAVFMNAAAAPDAYKGWRQGWFAGAATFLGWLGAGAVLASCIVSIVAHGSVRQAARVGLHGALGSAAAIAIIVGLDSFWAGSIGEVFDRLIRAGDSAGSVSTISTALRVHATILPRFIGWGSVVMLPIGLLSLVRGARRSAAIRMTLALALGWIGLGLINLVIFSVRASNHEFWFLPGLPGIAIGVAGVGLLFERGGSLRRILAIALAAAVCVQGVMAISEVRRAAEHSHDAARFGAIVDQYAPPNSLFIFPYDIERSWVWTYYTRAMDRPAIDPNIQMATLEVPDRARLDEMQRAGIERAIDRFLAGEFTVSTLIIMTDRSDPIESSLEGRGAHRDVLTPRYSIWRFR